MFRVVCTLPNMSALVNGIVFEEQPDRSWLSEDVTDEVAEGFLRIPGYELAEAAPPPPVPLPAPLPAPLPDPDHKRRGTRAPAPKPDATA